MKRSIPSGRADTALMALVRAFWNREYKSNSSTKEKSVIPREQVSTMPRCWQMPIFSASSTSNTSLPELAGRS